MDEAAQNLLRCEAGERHAMPVRDVKSARVAAEASLAVEPSVDARLEPAPSGCSELDHVACRRVDHLGKRWGHHGANIDVHWLLQRTSVHRQKGLGVGRSVHFVRLGIAFGPCHRKVHGLELSVERSVVVPEEGHAEDPHRPVLRVHLDRHECRQAHVDLPDLGLEEQNVPDAVGLHHCTCDSHNIRLRRQAEVGAVDVEMQGGQLVQVGAIFQNRRDLGAQLHQCRGWRGNEGGAAVYDGSTLCEHARGVLHLMTNVPEGDVVHTRDPVVLADDISPRIMLVLVVWLGKRTPGKEAV
mmetsp:Transcript_56571/g.143128  ORF Transcript_56571/g.143128 Transcript_56571/m.143128 type:complete len:298 (+) Transcript_56571:133-1026(+)